MARKFPEELNEAIWALMGLELSAPKIREKLANGEAGLKNPIRISLRTVQLRMARLRRARGAPEIPDQPVEEVATAVAHETLIAARRQVAMIPRNRLAKPQELASLERLTRIVNELRKGPRPASDHTKRGGQAKHRSTKPKDLLELLAEEENAKTSVRSLSQSPIEKREANAARRSASAPAKTRPEHEGAKPSSEHDREQLPSSRTGPGAGAPQAR